MSKIDKDAEFSKPLNYMDLLLITLTEYEKRLNTIVDRLEDIAEKLEELTQILVE